MGCEGHPLWRVRFAACSSLFDVDADASVADFRELWDFWADFLIFRSTFGTISA
jgi:hypothetical protein